MTDTPLNINDWSISTGNTRIELARGVTCPQSIAANGPYRLPHSGPTLQVRILASYRRHLQKFMIRETTVTAPDDLTITGAELRGVSPQRVLRNVLRSVVTVDPNVVNPFAQRFLSGVTTGQYGGIEAETSLDDTMQVYQLAVSMGENPTKAVSDTFVIPKRTARNRINRAHDMWSLDDHTFQTSVEGVAHV